MLRLTRRQAQVFKASFAPDRPSTMILVGSVRSGKTHVSIHAFARVMMERAQNPDRCEGVVLVVGKSTNTVYRNIFQLIVSNPEFAAYAPYLKYRNGATQGEFFGQPFSVVGAHDESSADNIQGLTVAFCLGDEATTWPESFWNMLQSRLSLGYSWVLVTCNPGTSNHYLKRLIDSGSPDVQTEVMLLRHNTTLDKQVMERLERSFTGLFYLRMILAQWVAAEGAVYQQWEPEKMVQSTVLPQHTLAVGIDYGTNHPTAGYALGVVDGVLRVFSEWSPNLEGGGHRRLTDQQLADSLQEWLGALPTYPRYIYCDPSAASFREELRTRRINTIRADNTVVDGIRTIDSLLCGGLLTIDPACEQLINEIPGYRWDSKAVTKGKDAPIKENDDHCDALRYTVYSSRHAWRRYLPKGAM